MKEEIKAHWYMIVIFVCFVGLLFLWEKNKTNLHEIDELKTLINTEKSIKETEAKLEEMKERERILYPEIQKKQKELRNVDQQIQEERNKLKLIKKERIKHELEKMDEYQLNNYFNELGYPTKIVGD